MKKAKYNKCAATFTILEGFRGECEGRVQHFQKAKIKNLWYWESIAMVYVEEWDFKGFLKSERKVEILILGVFKRALLLKIGFGAFLD